MGMHLGMVFALGSTFFARLGAQRQQRVKPGGSSARLAHRLTRQSGANIGAIRVEADTAFKPSGVFLGKARIGAARADGRAAYRFGNRMSQGLIFAA